ncbi:MAG: peptide chain release factor N(5)-glutamine methyltransferase [Rhodobacterales bacterium]|nr:peptide chain release factor N(5)-glutamine methyltransferase [Rhodobacterales bacterium]
MRAAEALGAATRALAAAGVPDAPRDARRLLAHALGIAPGRLTLALPEPLPDAARAAFDRLITRRSAREPVSHLTGLRAFYGRDFIVTADVLDPRPETETLIEAALAEPFADVLDLGTGSGCILLTLLAENPAARGLGVDLSAAACRVALRNARALGLDARAALRVSDWTAEVAELYDLIVANPPYIAQDEMLSLAPEVRDWEPRLALTDEGDGLGAYRRIMSCAPPFLRPGGRLIVEIGPTQAAAVTTFARAAGFGAVAVIADLDGRDRVIVCHWDKTA